MLNRSVDGMRDTYVGALVTFSRLLYLPYIPDADYGFRIVEPGDAGLVLRVEPGFNLPQDASFWVLMSSPHAVVRYWVQSGTETLFRTETLLAAAEG